MNDGFFLLLFSFLFFFIQCEIWSLEETRSGASKHTVINQKSCSLLECQSSQVGVEKHGQKNPLILNFYASVLISLRAHKRCSTEACRRQRRLTHLSVCSEMLRYKGAASKGLKRPSKSGEGRGAGGLSPTGGKRDLLNFLRLQRAPLFSESEWLQGTMAPKWSSSDKSKLTLTPRLQSLLELIWRVLHVNLRLCSALLSLVVLRWKRCQPMQTSSGRSRAASFNILHRGSRTGRVWANTQLSGTNSWQGINAAGWTGRLNFTRIMFTAPNLHTIVL